MGTFHAAIEVAGASDGPFEALDALVDSGATYSLLPGDQLRRLGVSPTDRQVFLLADGRQAEREIGQVWIRIEGHVRMSVVVFGPDDVQPLLGAVTLGDFGFGIDPVKGELVEAPSYLVGLPEGNNS